MGFFVKQKIPFDLCARPFEKNFQKKNHCRWVPVNDLFLYLTWNIFYKKRVIFLPRWKFFVIFLRFFMIFCNFSPKITKNLTKCFLQGLQMPRPVSYFFLFFYGPMPFLIKVFLINNTACNVGYFGDRLVKQQGRV